MISAASFNFYLEVLARVTELQEKLVREPGNQLLRRRIRALWEEIPEDFA